MAKMTRGDWIRSLDDVRLTKLLLKNICQVCYLREGCSSDLRRKCYSNIKKSLSEEIEVDEK
jgi:ribosomal protein L40E